MSSEDRNYGIYKKHSLMIEAIEDDFMKDPGLE